MIRETICWNCKNAVMGCSWSKEFVPVDGWEAEYKPVLTSDGSNRRLVDSYLVTECPLYAPDREPEKPKEEKPAKVVDPTDFGVKHKTMRMDIVECKQKGMKYKEITEATGAPKSTIIHHLKTARALGLI